MQEIPSPRNTLTLSELNSLIRTAVTLAFPEACWVIAEIAEAKCNQRGHCYLELVEKEDDTVKAQMRATIWAYDYRRLCQKFEGVTQESLKAGMKVLLLASVTFHEVYGLSLNVKDIDPSYTLGEMARRKKEVIEKLIREGIMALNRSLPLPPAPQRIAVISSPTAAGYGDFLNHLDNNPYGYKFVHVLFKAVVQGQGAEGSLLSAIDRIARLARHFDVVALIRGGGSTVDLSCFDSYALASRIARFPLPVITGIGHERDDTVADMVAHTKMKTPTAVADFLISGIRSFEEKIIDIWSKIETYSERFLRDELNALDALAGRLVLVPARMTSERHRLAMHLRDLIDYERQILRNATVALDRMEQASRLLAPANVLRRGYSITRHSGKVIRDASHLKKGDVIETRLHSGAVTSVVGQKKAEPKKEVSADEQEQTGYLFTGTDGA